MNLPLRVANILINALILIGIASTLAESASPTPNPAINQYICPSGFDLVRGQCRGFAQTGTNVGLNKGLEKAVEVCKDFNALPPIIRNQEDHVDFISVNYISLYRAIGISCNETTKKWQWIDGTQIDFKPESYDSHLDSTCTSSEGSWYYREKYDYWFYFDSGTISVDFYCISDLKKPELREDDCIQFDKDDQYSICYQVSESPEYWSDAQDKCKSVRSNLASIHSAQENSFIRRLAVSNGLVNGLSLGASVAGKANNFGWLDGSNWNYTNFLPGFPLDGFGDCLAMDTSDFNGEWINTECSTKLPYVCSRKPFIDSPAGTCPGPNVKEGDIIRTPGFPTDASTYCDFFLKVDVGKVVEIEVLLLQANNCCDHFVLYEGSLGGEMIANLTGGISGPKYRTTSSNIMRASWQPNGGVNVRGAMFTFKGV